MAYRFLGVKLLPGTHHLFLGTPKLVLGTFWLLGTTPPFLGTLERFLGMPKIKVLPETPYRGLLIHFIHSAIRSCTKRAVPKIGNVQRTLSGIGSRSTGTTLTMESCTRTTGTSN